MDVQALRAACIRQLGIRIGPHTGGYLLKHLSAPAPPAQVPVMGGDSRTGIPVRKDVPLTMLTKAAGEAPPAGAP